MVLTIPLLEVLAEVVALVEQVLMEIQTQHQTLVDLELHLRLLAPLQPVVLVVLVVVTLVNQRVLMELLALETAVVEVVVPEMQEEAVDLELL
jgi:hypothetical protein